MLMNPTHNEYTGLAVAGFVLSATPEELNLIEETLRRAGYDATIQRVDAPENFPSAITAASSQNAPWDVFLISSTAPLETVDALAQLQQDEPCFSVGETGSLKLPPSCKPSTLQHLGADIARACEQHKSQKEARLEIVLAQQKAELAVRESEERYRALVESTFDLVCELDPEGRCIYVSPNYSQRLGFVVGELLGETIFECLHPQDQDKVIAKFANLMAGKPNGPVEYRHAHKNGEWVWLEGAMRAVRGSRPDQVAQRVVLIARDIGERKRHERERAALIPLAKPINDQTDLPPSRAKSMLIFSR